MGGYQTVGASEVEVTDGGSVCDAMAFCDETIVGGGLLAALVTMKVGDGVGESAALGNAVTKVARDVVCEPRALADAVGETVLDAVDACVEDFALLGNSVGASAPIVGETVEGLIENCSRPGELVVVRGAMGTSVDTTTGDESVLEVLGAIV